MSKPKPVPCAVAHRSRRALGILILCTLTSVARGQEPAASEPLWLVNLNTASAEELERLPGIGPARARAIIEYRARRPFRSAEEAIRVKGIGPKLFRKIRPHVVVKVKDGAAAARPNRPGAVAGSPSDAR